MNSTTILLNASTTMIPNVTSRSTIPKENTGVGEKSMTLVITEVTIYCLIFILSSIGNISVITVVSRKRRMQTVTNWLIVNLAVADLAVTLICIPVEIPLFLNGGIWLYGKVFCRMLYPLQTMTIYASVYTLVAMSLTRYWAILHPFRRQISPKQAKIIICILWIVCFCFVIPYIMSLSLDETQQACVEIMTVEQSRSYTIAIFVSQYVFPVMIISIAYILIAIDLKLGRKKSDSLLQRQQHKENTRVLSTVVIVTVTFAICVLPYHVVGLHNQFSGNASFPHKEEISSASYLLLFANSCMNPIIYNAFNSKFRHSFFEQLHEILHCGKKSDNRPQSTMLTMRTLQKECNGNNKDYCRNTLIENNKEETV
eukprot:gene7102-7905_t